MNEKLMRYLDGMFLPYKDLHSVEELKEELHVDLQEKFSDYKEAGHDDETAYRMTIESIGDIEEMVDSITHRIKDLRQSAKRDISMSNLQESDFKGIIQHNAKFDYSSLLGSDFSGADLTNCSFKCSGMVNVRFDGANLTGAKFVMTALRGASFKDCILDNTDFNTSDLSGVCFDNLTFNGTIFNKAGLKGTSFKSAVFRNVSFKNTDARKAVFDGAAMDKLTYAVLKGSKANLTNVTVI
ncbi:pentapeptide repeat-containing protein [Phosphitispora fastidiosa]|uniref:pentapeptide repeat-containing protein n=1 Tax=Phosphitispora fastidiosa TaxID=2837202 RepID=UPI001E5D7893|nr:pentapeptide repeat-containing protein [Phosphitispora fastidiosa]MBU7006057.1 putative protein YjbI with pentapeptide repeats [Phosphitispora fastidiosa]